MLVTDQIEDMGSIYINMHWILQQNAINSNSGMHKYVVYQHFNINRFKI